MPPEPDPEKYPEDRRVDERFGDILFYLPPEMPDTERADEVHGVVQQLPASPETPPHAVRRGRCECRQEHEGREADRDERPLHQILRDRGQAHSLVENQPGQKVVQRVEKRKQAEHAAELQKLVPAADAAQWRDGQRDHDEAQGPVAEAIQDLLHRVGTEPARDLEGVGYDEDSR